MRRRSSTGTRTPPGRIAAAAVLIALLPGCPPIRDRIARDDVSSLQTNVQEMESVIRARQAGVIEQIREVREEQARLDKLLQDAQLQDKDLGKRVAQLGERTREELARRDQRAAESSRAAEERAAKLDQRLEASRASLQASLQTLNENLVAMSAFEKKQEERIAQAEQQVQGQIKVIVEEVGQANAALERSAGALREDLDAGREESAATRKALGRLQEAMQQIADQLAASQAEIRELGRKLDAVRKTARAGGSIHVVRAGETLTAIAARYGVSLEAIMRKNNLADANALSEGQKLAIPEP